MSGEQYFGVLSQLAEKLRNPAYLEEQKPSNFSLAREYGNRIDGTKKAQGFFGELQRPDGDYSTELSIGVNIGGKDQEIPMIVPTLNPNELNYILGGGEPTPEIVQKAVDHAISRGKSAKPFFATPSEPIFTPPSGLLGILPFQLNMEKFK